MPRDRATCAGGGAAGCRLLDVQARRRPVRRRRLRGRGLLLWPLAHRPGGRRAQATQRLRAVCGQVPAEGLHQDHRVHPARQQAADAHRDPDHAGGTHPHTPAPSPGCRWHPHAHPAPDAARTP
eukprot:6439060-Prymnesium_polylepis.1